MSNNAQNSTGTLAHTTQKYNGVTRYLPNPPKLLADQRQNFLDILKEKDGNITATAKVLDVSKRTIYRRMAEDQEFKRSVELVRWECDEEFVDALEAVSRKCALEEKNVRERLAQLKANMPHKYRERGHPFQTLINVTVAGIPIKDREKEIKRREKQQREKDELADWREVDSTEK